MLARDIEGGILGWTPSYGCWFFSIRSLNNFHSYSFIFIITALDGDVLKTRYTTTNLSKLVLVKPVFPIPGGLVYLTETLKITYHAVAQTHNTWLNLEPQNIIVSHLVVTVNIFLRGSTFVKVKMRFNWYLGKISKKKSICVILLEIGDTGK